MSTTNGQRRFAVMGNNTFRIVEKLISNQALCRLLKYQVKDPFSSSLADVDGLELLNKQICIVPKIYDDSTEKTSYITALFDNITNSVNNQFKVTTVRFDIACPYDEWILEANSLRPYLMMQEIDSMFNQKDLAGVGKLQFAHATSLVLSPQIGGYSMEYVLDEYN